MAQSQQGFFTTKQAIRSGFAEKTHSYHVNAGNWIREHGGIYRLADFPTPERPDLMLWYLWSQDRQEVPEGTYSHETALSLHELSDIMPSKLHMTNTGLASVASRRRLSQSSRRRSNQRDPQDEVGKIGKVAAHPYTRVSTLCAYIPDGQALLLLLVTA
jgi:hypothetical protein